MPRSFNSWLDYLNSIHSTAIDLSLERIQPLATAMDLIHFPCPVITVAGTNGKGSCVRLLESAYLAAGYQVAAYTSPHLIHFTERLRINDEMLSEADWIEAFETVEEARAQLSLSFFEFTTLAALWLCKRCSLDVIILEVGLGGRLDAVNVVENDLAIITTIDFDHQEYLGNTREAIAQEKADIFKEGRLAICGDSQIPLSVFETAAAKHVSLYTLNRDYFYESYDKSWVWMSEQQRYDHLPLPVLNLQDAATSLTALNLLQKRLPVQFKAIQESFATAQLTGRFELIKTPVADLYLDVAHNPHAVDYLAKNLQKLPVNAEAKTLAVFGMLKDKDAAACVALMEPLVDEWYVADLPVERARPASELAERIVAYGKNCYTFPSVAEALRAALGSCRLPDRVVVFGSFYTVAGAMEWLQRAEADEEPATPTIERRLSVTPQMRHRIVGILVLLGLTALFLPLLFSDKEPVDSIANLSKQIPKAPAMPEVKMELTTPKLNQSGSTTVLSSATPSSNITTKPEAADNNSASVPAETHGQTSAMAANKAHATNDPQALSAQKTAAEAVSSASSTIPADHVVTKTTTSASPSMLAIPSVSSAPDLSQAPSAWTIQVASYANNVTAQNLVQRLRAQGYEAYTREITTSNGQQMTRVFVGPEISQARVKQLQQQLKQRFKLNGVISKYSVN